MAKVTITLSDQDGAIKADVVFQGGPFDPKSHAHQHAQLLLKHMDEIAQRQGEPEIKAIDKLHEQAARENSVESRLRIVKG